MSMRGIVMRLYRCTCAKRRPGYGYTPRRTLQSRISWPRVAVASTAATHSSMNTPQLCVSFCGGTLNRHTAHPGPHASSLESVPSSSRATAIALSDTRDSNCVSASPPTGVRSNAQHHNLGRSLRVTGGHRVDGADALVFGVNDQAHPVTFADAHGYTHRRNRGQTLADVPHLQYTYQSCMGTRARAATARTHIVPDCAPQHPLYAGPLR